MCRGRETALGSRPRLANFELILFIHPSESPIISRMSDTLAKPELLRSLGRLVRGLSALFWGLPAALLICVETARAVAVFALLTLAGMKCAFEILRLVAMTGGAGSSTNSGSARNANVAERTPVLRLCFRQRVAR